tara:strand:+ start:323 stop:1120 length:798 start_codon:yes stop_codon:yes gene_type:complete
MADRAKFLDFLDMIDGGGAGQRGDMFEGGGIFSALANLMPINPFGSEDPTRRRARDAFYGGLLGDSPDTVSAAEAAATPAITQRQRMSAAMADEARQRGLLQDALDPRGVSQMRPLAPVGSGRGTMDMPMQGSGRGTMNMPMPPQNQVEPRPSVMSVGPAQPTSVGVPMGPQPQMQTSMVGSTGFEEGDMRGRIDGTISGGVTPSVLGSPSLRVRSSADTQPMTFEEFAQQQSILPSVGLDQLRSLYENYLNFIRRNNTIGNLTR